MEAFAPDRVDELVRVYRAHNEPLHDELEAFVGHRGDADDAQGARPPARPRHRQAPRDRRPRVRAPADRALLRHRRRRRRDRAHKPNPEPLLLGLERLDATADQAAYVGDSPYDMQAAKAGGLYAVGVTWGRIHDRAALADADVVVDTAEELLAVL